jgi:hypothetical protein
MTPERIAAAYVHLRLGNLGIPCGHHETQYAYTMKANEQGAYVPVPSFGMAKIFNSRR